MKHKWQAFQLLMIASGLLFLLQWCSAPMKADIYAHPAITAFLYLLALRAAAFVTLSFAERHTRHTPPLTEFPIVTAIVPCFNEQEVIQPSIQSLLEINYPNLEILVVDDGSTDGTL